MEDKLRAGAVQTQDEDAPPPLPESKHIIVSLA